MNIHLEENNLQSVIRIKGYLNFESANLLEKQLQQFFQKIQATHPVVIDLHQLEFIGSSGVSSFVKVLVDFNKRASKPLYVGVKKEFIKLFRAFEGPNIFQIQESPSVIHAKFRNVEL